MNVYTRVTHDTQVTHIMHVTHATHVTRVTHACHMYTMLHECVYIVCIFHPPKHMRVMCVTYDVHVCSARALAVYIPHSQHRLLHTFTH